MATSSARRANHGTAAWKAPYVAFATFDSFMAAADDVTDRETLNAALASVAPPTKRSELRTALHSLGIVDNDGKPSLQLFRYARQPEERPTVLRGLLERHYPAAVAVANAGASREEVAASFDPPITLARTGGRAVAFFLAMLEAAGGTPLAQSSVAPPADAPIEDSYGVALAAAIDRLGQGDLSDGATWEHFNALCDRYERWQKRRR